MTPWEILGIAKDADKREIKKAYSKLIKAHRPDDAPEQFQQIRNAYEHMLDNLTGASVNNQPFAAVDLSDTPSTSAELPGPVTTPSPKHNQQETKHTAGTPGSNNTDVATTAEENTDANRETALQADAFISSFKSLIAKFPDNGKLTARDTELCRLETTTLMSSELLNHWHAREYLSVSVFEQLCENIAISSGLFSTTTNFPAAFLHYLDQQFLWTENEVALCEACEDDSASLVFHVIHEGRNSSSPKWSDLPDPSADGVATENNSGQSLSDKVAALFTRSK